MHPQVQLFDAQQFGQIRFVIRDGEPWFVAADVCKALDIQNITQALGNLDDDEKCKIEENRITTDPIHYIGPTVTPFLHEVNLVNEPGLYRLIFASRKPNAKIFKRKVYHEILPSIRKTGFYIDRDNPALRKKIEMINAAERWAQEIDISKRLKKYFAEQAEFYVRELVEQSLAHDDATKLAFELRTDKNGDRIETPYFLRLFIAKFCVFDRYSHLPAEIFIKRLREEFPQASAKESNRAILTDLRAIKGIDVIRSDYGGALLFGIRFANSTNPLLDIAHSPA